MNRPNTGYAFLYQVDSDTYRVEDFSSKYAKPKLKNGFHVKIIKGSILTKFTNDSNQIISVVSEDDIIMIVENVSETMVLVETVTELRAS